MFNGNYQLNSTGGTKIYINLDIPEVQHFKKEMVDVPLQEIVRIEVAQPESLEEAMIKNRKTIKELQQLYMEGEENEEIMNTYTCVAQISFIHDQECGWMYTSCNNCKSRVDENQYCNKCQVVPEYPIDRYRIIATIDDGHAKMTVGIFDKDVEKIIGKPITSMMKIYDQENGAEKVSNELQQCIGKTCTLKLKVYNKGYIQELTAIKVYHVETDEKVTTKRQGKEILKEIKKEGRQNKKQKTPRAGTTEEIPTTSTSPTTNQEQIQLTDDGKNS
ncbi:replication protein A 70 kDa DNA-binding subunit B [Spinacia oleracea]|uniref:Replication protein A 70 kDa DNA-binding subunit B n=1 Tax=Spinacia oleracea TaxID=3562 RepID=A0ABM3RVL0_SPIOL|nr:replication protein A 70 kDa DNA-binding subunit B-like [Spinacia oleracea]